MNNSSQNQHLTSAFNSASSQGALSGRKTYPFSIRLTKAERAYLENQAGGNSLGAYCRKVLLADLAETRRELRKPPLGDEQYSALLAALGQSRLSSNLNQLAKHANMGTLDISDDIEAQLQEAYQVILEMRKALFIALGLKVG
ncbi:MAG: hypothetical protein ACRBB4_15835 [Neptuniibacter sp.]